VQTGKFVKDLRKNVLIGNQNRAVFSETKEDPLMRIQWRNLWLVITKGAAPFWIAAGGLLVSGILGKVLGARAGVSVEILYAGTLLDFFGLLLVAQGLSETRKQFGQPSLFGRVRQWLRLLADTFRGKEHTSIATATGRLNIRTGPVNLKFGAADNATIEQRVQLLEQNLDRLSEEHRKMIERNETQLAAINQTLQQERQERTAGETRLSRQIEDLAVGDFHYEVIGIVWLLFGIIFTNIPDVVANVIHFFQ
jgi:hypothetical protein